jgi:hypothetical protein
MSSSSLLQQHLEELPEELTGRILLFCDFESAITFSRTTSKALRTRYEQAELRHVWREIYHRHGFGPLEEEKEEGNTTTTATIARQQQQQHYNHNHDYIGETLLRRQLLTNLLQNKKTKKSSAKKKLKTQCSNLPHRYFRFLPIVPKQQLFLDDDFEAVDPPPIFYECDSFVLTSTGTGSELVLLNPFDGSLSVLGDIQEYCVASDGEAGMMALMGDHQKKDNWMADYSCCGEPRNYTGDMTESYTYTHLSPPNEQCLLHSDDYFQFDIAPYFPHRQNMQLTEEYELTFMGTDAKPILNGRTLVGSMVGIGRSVRNVQDINVVCTELTAWTRLQGEVEYGNRMICRFPWTFHLVDMDAAHQRFFVSFHKGDGPLGHRERPANTSSSRLAVYPMGSICQASYFPAPLFTIECGEPISSFVLDSTGDTLIVTTKGGNLQLWDVRKNQQAKRIQKIRLRDALRESIRSKSARNTKSSLAETDAEQTDAEQTAKDIASTAPDSAAAASASEPLIPAASEPLIPAASEPLIPAAQVIHNDPTASNGDAQCVDNGIGALSALCQQLEAARFRCPVDSIFVSKHDSQTSGFVTLQRHRDEGTSLLLWRQGKVVSLINVPLSPKRVPRVYYEGNRLVVFGEDHIGMIILVYNVACDDFVVATSDDDEPLGEASGGVFNLTRPPVVRFANRVRHVALGGIDTFDSIHMTCNERFLIVNTRTGNLLGECPLPEGLLVIDLLDNTKCEYAFDSSLFVLTD